MNKFPLLQVSEDDLIFLKWQWNILLAKYGTNKDDRNKLFNLIAESYSSEGRYYHNLHHISEVLRLIILFKDKVTNYDPVCLAAWFHDVIYDTKRNDNEERSAEFAARKLSGVGVPIGIIKNVQDLILATKKHDIGNLTTEAGIFLDADLSILGAPEEVYKQYSEAIRAEYSWVPGFLYRQNRKKILEGFLNRERIYFIHEIAARLEERARQNLRDEISTLS